MAENIEELKKKLEYYEKDPEKRAYFSLVRIVNQQVDYLNGFDIKNNIAGKASEDATFARTQGIWEKLPSMITSLNDLKTVLKIKRQDEEEEFKRQRTTPESVADNIGNVAGQNM
jgi:hypothetical protein